MYPFGSRVAQWLALWPHTPRPVGLGISPWRCACGFCMLSLCLCSFPLGTLVSFSGPKKHADRVWLYLWWTGSPQPFPEATKCRRAMFPKCQFIELWVLGEGVCWFLETNYTFSSYGCFMTPNIKRWSICHQQPQPKTPPTQSITIICTFLKVACGSTFRKVGRWFQG